MTTLEQILFENDIHVVTESWLDEVADEDITAQLAKQLMDYFIEDLKNEDTFVELADLLFENCEVIEG